MVNYNRETVSRNTDTIVYIRKKHLNVSFLHQISKQNTKDSDKHQQLYYISLSPQGSAIMPDTVYILKKLSFIVCVNDSNDD